MEHNPDIIVGGLLDLLEYTVAIRIHSADNVTRYFVSERVGDHRSYIFCLLLNLFGLPMENIDQLTTSSKGHEPFFRMKMKRTKINISNQITNSRRKRAKHMRRRSWKISMRNRDCC